MFPVMTEKDVRQTLASYLFRGRDASKRVADLSGGEKARLCLSELLGSRPNLLLLDEPTNHMDIPAKETLESAFCAYTGTILFVSHDRYFIRQVADAILVMDGDRVMYYPFGYDHYLERKGKGEGESLTALLRSEDQAMLESFRSVPEKERGMLRQIGTEEAYRDWRHRLAKEDLEATEAAAREALEKLDEKRLAEWKAWAEGNPEAASSDKETVDSVGKVLDRWTEACIAFAET